MCDSHELYDASVSPEMVGRTLTVERVRQLNTRQYFYDMLKNNPALTAIHPGIENRVLEGAIDHHIHASPDFVHRSQDMMQVAVDASRARMRAIAFKDHWNLSANAAYFVQQRVDELVLDGRLEHRVEVYGGIGLNHGAIPEMVRVGLKYPNFKCIWFPTFRSFGWARFAGLDPDEDEYVRLVDGAGNVLPNVREIFELAAEADVCVALGHTDFEELLPLCTLANQLGVRTVLDHPLLELNKLLIDELAQLAELGTYVGTYCQPMIPSIYQPVQDPMETVEVINRIGASRCLAASDFGQVLHLDAVDGVRVFVRALLGFGVAESDVKLMLCDNPARLLGLDAA